MAYVYDLVLGLPHTNHRGLSEPLLLMQAGHAQWASIASAVGRPLSRLRTSDGSEVYAAFYYVEERLPDHAPLESFRLDDAIRFGIGLRSFKNLSFEGRVVFDHADKLPDERSIDEVLRAPGADCPHPSLRFGNIFITPEKGNRMLRVAPPAGVDISDLPVLPNEENPYQFTRAALQTGELGLFDDSWAPTGAVFEHRHAIDIDRDTNGAGLVYFAQYVAFMETAERLAVASNRSEIDPVMARTRSLRHRRIAYYGNAELFDTVVIRVRLFQRTDSTRWLGLQFVVEREEDGAKICLSESLKVV
jgi:probable biosynthetic protein (TIGR04098 family)